MRRLRASPFGARLATDLAAPSWALGVAVAVLALSWRALPPFRVAGSAAGGPLRRARPAQKLRTSGIGVAPRCPACPGRLPPSPCSRPLSAGGVVVTCRMPSSIP
eukprot:2826796-Alexandrium_andersonii.AAC.1